MPKATKAELKKAITLMRMTAARYACGLMTGRKSEQNSPIVWRGIKIEIEIVKRQQVVCNVPAPYCAFHFYYRASVDGKSIAHGESVGQLADNLFRYCPDRIA